MGGCPHHVIILVPQSSYLKSDLQHGLVGMVTLWYTCIHIHSYTTMDNTSYKIRSQLKLSSNTLMTPTPWNTTTKIKLRVAHFDSGFHYTISRIHLKAKWKKAMFLFLCDDFKITFRICSGVPCGVPGITGVTGLNDRVIGSREQQDKL